MSAETNIQRFTPSTEWERGVEDAYPVATMVPSKTGEWVRLDEVVRKLRREFDAHALCDPDGCSVGTDIEEMIEEWTD